MLRVVRGVPPLLCYTARFGALRSLSRTRARYLVNEPKYDEAEILAQGINHSEFKAKRTSIPFLTNEDASDDAKQVTLERMQKLQTGAIATLTVLGLILGGSYYVYDKNQKEAKLKEELEWAAISSGSTKRKGKKKKAKLSKLKPVVPADQLDSSHPGLYCWGSPTSATTWDAIPKRVTLFDNVVLRDVCLIDAKQNLVVDNKGDLLNWDQGQDTLVPVLKKQNLQKIKESNGVLYGLNNRGEVLVMPLADIEKLDQYIEKRKRVWFLPRVSYINSYSTYGQKLDTKSLFDKRLGEGKVTGFDTGSHHLVLVSDAGKAYSCSTGTSTQINDTHQSKGQFGLPNLSQYSEYPEVNKLHEIELLNKALSTRKKGGVQFRDIVKVACGDYHTVAIDSKGGLFSFGWNRYGQLGLNISYENEITPYPKQLSLYTFVPFFNDGVADLEEGEIGRGGPKYNVKCVDVSCSKETTYVTVENELGTSKCFSFGNGSNGELGDGSFRNSQFKPARVKLDGGVSSWYTNKSASHAVCLLDNNEVESWGLNDKGQVGNWQRGKFKFCKPETLPLLLEPGVQYSENEDVSSLPKLQIDPTKQRLSVGTDSTCLYWTSK